MEPARSQNSWKSRWVASVLLLMPLWFPYAYVAVSFLEKKLLRHSILDNLFLVALVISSAIATVPIARDNTSLATKLFFVPLFYFVAVVISFVMCFVWHIEFFGP
jgi:hypothetical protein